MRRLAHGFLGKGRRGLALIAVSTMIAGGAILAISGASAQASAPSHAFTAVPAVAGAPVTNHAPTAPAVKSDCPATYFCVWNSSGYSDGPAKFAGNNTNWGNFSHSSCPSGTWNDCASSGFNNGTSGFGVEVWQNINYGGASACLPRGWSLNNFAGFVYPGTSVSFNNSISSNFWTSIC
jgi:hypothetical protein